VAGAVAGACRGWEPLRSRQHRRPHPGSRGSIRQTIRCTTLPPFRAGSSRARTAALVAAALRRPRQRDGDSLVMDPFDHQTLWAGTGEGYFREEQRGTGLPLRGHGIFKTETGAPPGSGSPRPQARTSTGERPGGQLEHAGPALRRHRGPGCFARSTAVTPGSASSTPAVRAAASTWRCAPTGPATRCLPPAARFAPGLRCIARWRRRRQWLDPGALRVRHGAHLAGDRAVAQDVIYALAASNLSARSAARIRPARGLPLDQRGRRRELGRRK